MPEASAANLIEDEDEFQDAVENAGPDRQGNWDVTVEELSIIRAELACEYPDDYSYMSDDYIISLASKPYSKDMSIRRPLDYSIEKLKAVLQWRESYGAPDLLELIEIANGPDSSPEARKDPDRLAQAQAVATSLNAGGLYWHGLTKSGKPIMWIRCDRMPWYPDTVALLKALVLISDIGITRMPKGVTDFAIVADSSSPPPPHPTFLVSLMNALVKGFPDRLGTLTSAPTPSIMQFVMNLLLPLMPARLAGKFFFIGTEEARTQLEGLLLNGKDDIPNFFGGPIDHDIFYPTESYCPNRGKGNLKFDFYGMCERLEAARDDFDASSPK